MSKQLKVDRLATRVRQTKYEASHLESVADGKDVLHVELVRGDVKDAQNPGDTH